MKKLYSILLVLLLCVTLSACGKEEIPLTLENYQDYLKIETQLDITDLSQETNKFINYMSSYSGTGTIEVTVIPITNASYENVTINGIVTLGDRFLPTTYWEWKTGGFLASDDFPDNTWSKRFSITLPYDGKASLTDDIFMDQYDYSFKSFNYMSKSFLVTLEITSISGSVIK